MDGARGGGCFAGQRLRWRHDIYTLNKNKNTCCNKLIHFTKCFTSSFASFVHVISVISSRSVRQTCLCTNKLKQQGVGAGETSITTNYELQGTDRATRAPVAQTLQSVRQTCLCTIATCPYRFARFPSCGIFTSTRTSPVKQRVETTV